MRKGVLLVNLGAPDSPEPRNVRRYLDEFLMDERGEEFHVVPRLNDDTERVKVMARWIDKWATEETAAVQWPRYPPEHLAMNLLENF